MAGPFKMPVNPIALGIPDYHEIIKQPMDLSTVSQNLHKGKYSDQNDFLRDMRLIWSNSLTFNNQDSDIYQMTIEIQEFFEEIYKETFEPSQEVKKQVQNPQVIEEKQKRQPQKRDTLKPLTNLEKRSLGQNIKQLPHDLLLGVWQIVCTSNQGSTQDNGFEFDLDTLPTKQCRELEAYIKKCQQQIQSQNMTRVTPTKYFYEEPSQITKMIQQEQNIVQTSQVGNEQNTKFDEESNSMSSLISDSDDSSN